MTIAHKAIIFLALILLSITIGVIYGHNAGAKSVQTVFDEFKESIRVQIEKTKIENAATEAAQDAKFNHAQAGYSDDVARLNRILAGLRKPKVVPGGAGVPVANPDGGSLPCDAKDTPGVADAAFIGTGTHTASEFYSMSMADTLQCTTLIKFLKVI